MAKDVLHVVPNGDGWAVKKEGNERASSTHDTQKAAIDGARSLAKEGDDIVIHRQDGSIREHVTYTGRDSNSNGGDNDAPARPRAHDIWSVGSRVSWPAVLAGVVVALAVSALLMALAAALGVTFMDQMRPRTATVVGGTVWFVVMFVALMAGGYIATRLTTRETQFEAVILGTLVWGTTFALAMVGLGAGAGLALDATRSATVMSADRPFWRDLDWSADQTRRYEAMTNPDAERVRQELGLTEDQARRFTEEKERAKAWAREHPRLMAWCAFFGMAVSLASAIGGALLRAGPDVQRRTLRADTTGVGTAAASREPVTV